MPKAAPDIAEFAAPTLTSKFSCRYWMGICNTPHFHQVFRAPFAL
jgi:hypothetical protein